MNKKIARWKRQLPLFAAMLALVLFVVVSLAFAGTLTAKDIGAGFLSLFGTFIGAFLAFRLQQIKDADVLEVSRVDAINRSLIVLIFQYNHLAMWQRTIDEYEGDLARMINLPAERDSEHFDLRQSVESLAFLAETGHGDLIMKVGIEQARFDAARLAISERCRLLVSEIQPAIEEHRLQHQRLDEAVFRAALGERLFGALETATAEVYRHVPLTVASLTEAIGELHGVGKALYPHRTVLKMEPQ